MADDRGRKTRPVPLVFTRREKVKAMPIPSSISIAGVVIRLTDKRV